MFTYKRNVLILVMVISNIVDVRLYILIEKGTLKLMLISFHLHQYSKTRINIA